MDQLSWCKLLVIFNKMSAPVGSAIMSVHNFLMCLFCTANLTWQMHANFWLANYIWTQKFFLSQSRIFEIDYKKKKKQWEKKSQSDNWLNGCKVVHEVSIKLWFWNRNCIYMYASNLYIESVDIDVMDF